MDEKKSILLIMRKKIYRAISIVIIVLLAFFVGYMVSVGRMIG